MAAKKRAKKSAKRPAKKAAKRPAKRSVNKKSPRKAATSKQKKAAARRTLSKTYVVEAKAGRDRGKVEVSARHPREAFGKARALIEKKAKGRDFELTKAYPKGARKRK